MAQRRGEPIACHHPDRPRFSRQACQWCYQRWRNSVPPDQHRRNRPQLDIKPLTAAAADAEANGHARHLVDALYALCSPRTLSFLTAELLRRAMLPATVGNKFP